jgi:teichuronic acid biosynthesis glycosyltransferase TuaH
MKIIWFSEIKWSYLKTRKQHILSHFDNTDDILFIEPVSFNLKNKFNISIEKNIKYLTIPQLQNSDIYLINCIINLSIFRWFIKKVSKHLMKRILTKINHNPNIIITSNVFWINYIKEFRDKKNIKVIYDCNDNPMAFPNSNNKIIYFKKTLKYSDKIIVPFKSYINFIPKKYHSKIEIISNGVDSNLILSNKGKKDSISSNFKNILKNNNQSIVMYAGSIDTRLDYDLIEKIVSELINIKFIFIGDIKRQINNKFIKIKNKKNFFHIKSVNYNQIGNYLSYANVCIIPFKSNELSKFILPNKIFEYSIIEKPFVLTNFNPELKDIYPDFLIANSQIEFSKLILNQIKNPSDTSKLKTFALKFEWNRISDQFRSMISDTLKK